MVALSYEYGMNSNNMEILPNSAEGRTNTNIILCSSNPCSENAECEDQEKGFFCKCNSGWLGKCKLYFLIFFQSLWPTYNALQCLNSMSVRSLK